ncbi:F-box protein At5g03100-like isoform X3 [Miscanthus floridulus]|uniref:F-box protein At5g03100-like isoform X3 n=1 Tax=Miscanthus floridulus TaxID=154761 RepID=UPI00345985EA
MPRGKTVKGAVQQPAGGSGGIESLPDGILEHILGFLPSAEAVRTSVLARRWRHLWKSATGLCVGCCDPDQQVSVEDLRSLVNHLLILRRGSPLEKCYFTFDAELISDDDVSHVNLWFRHVVTCKVHVLSLFIFGRSSGEPRLEQDNLPLRSQHLRRLELTTVQVHNSLLNFSNCPALDHLKIVDCKLSSVNKIVSESLKHLCIDLSVGSCDSHIRIYTPNVASLRLERFEGRTPILEGMPSLLEACVKITHSCRDYCTNANFFWTCDCGSCDSSDSAANGSINCVLLRGLSEANSLALKSDYGMFIFKRDLRWCPVFTNLKTLLLNCYWYVPDDFRALACSLEHSPVLEKLTFELHEWFGYKVQIKLRVSSMKRSSAISEHLKKVEINCQKGLWWK